MNVATAQAASPATATAPGADAAALPAADQAIAVGEAVGAQEASEPTLLDVSRAAADKIAQRRAKQRDEKRQADLAVQGAQADSARARQENAQLRQQIARLEAEISKSPIQRLFEKGVKPEDVRAELERGASPEYEAEKRLGAKIKELEDKLAAGETAQRQAAAQARIASAEQTVMRRAADPKEFPNLATQRPQAVLAEVKLVLEQGHKYLRSLNPNLAPEDPRVHYDDETALRFLEEQYATHAKTRSPDAAPAREPVPGSTPDAKRAGSAPSRKTLTNKTAPPVAFDFDQAAYDKMSPNQKTKYEQKWAAAAGILKEVPKK